MSAQVEMQRRRWVRGMAAPKTQQEIEIVLFAGAGGADFGIEKVTGKSVAMAVNHDPYAIAMHKLNHPGTYHFCCDVREVDPRSAFPDSPVGLLHLSPDCTHHSNAKGGQPVKKHIRGLANVGIVWAKARMPRVITLENVREFEDWGPLIQKKDKKGKLLFDKEGNPELMPDPKRKGQSFKRWKKKLEALGYKVEHRLLRAADFGAPTIRKRLFLVARRDGEAIHWPQPTHAPVDRAELLGLKVWNSAAGCINWDLLGKSIFDRDKPLAPNTMKRLAKGTVRHVLRAKKGPFLLGQGGPVYSGKPVSADEPLGTILKESHRAVAQPFLSLLNHGGEGFRGQDVDDPMTTLTASHDAHGLTAAYLTTYHGGPGGEDRAEDLRDPIPVIDTSNRFGKVAAFLAGVGGRAGQSPTRTPADPMRTTTSKADDAVTMAFLQGLGGREDQRPPRDLEEPLRTITQIEAEALSAVNLVRFKKNQAGGDITEPLKTITQKEADGLQVAFLEVMKGTATGYDARLPMPTVQAQGNHIAEVRLFLKEFCTDYDKLTEMEKLGILEINGQLYQITDITLRMLEPEELLKAQFGVYAEACTLTGTKKKKVAVIGNSVCPEVEEALIRANYFPRWLEEAA